MTTTPLALPAPGPVPPNRPVRPRRMPTERRAEDWEEAQNAADLAETGEKEEERPKQQAFAQLLIARDELLPEVMRMGWIGPSLGFFIQIYVQEHLGNGIHFDPWSRAAAAYERWQKIGSR